MKLCKIIATIGPASNNAPTLAKLKDRGVDFFRINLSHTSEKDIETRILELKPYNVPIILDTEGAQIRVGATENEVEIPEGSEVRIYSKPVTITSKALFFNPVEAVHSFSTGDLIHLDFNSLVLHVKDISKLKTRGYIVAYAIIGGKTGSRKAVFVDSPTFELPPFSKKDYHAFELAKKHNINHFTLSFMSRAEDVRLFRKICPKVIAFSKIESREGLRNFVEIMKESEGILVDRGDLSHQIPLERIPLTQKYIINICRQYKKEIFIATNTLEQMSVSLKPNRAEVNDIINTLLDGATGIALTKEVAIGKYPVETVNMLVTLISQLEFLKNNSAKKDILEQIKDTNYIYSPKVPRLLVAPHGGALVSRVSIGKWPHSSLSIKHININEETLMDLEQIGIGSFSPLDGFMTKKELMSVAEIMRLPGGIIWPLPILLRLSLKEIRGIKKGDHLALAYEKDSEVYGTIEVGDIYSVDKESLAKKIYGTLDRNHPGVAHFLKAGDYAIGGKITLLERRPAPFKMYELTPSQTRRIFTERGWSKVVGFHTRNVIHRSHEFIQLEALNQTHADGLFIHPVIGKKKSGDFEAEVIIKSYEHMVKNHYSHNVLFATLGSYSRYGGPREALFTALIRKNFGCSHFIVGRDHTGVGNYYAPQASHDIFDRFDARELGIIPVKFNHVFYSSKNKEHVHSQSDSASNDSDAKNISGTEARALFNKGKSPPEWFMRPEVSSIILERMKKGKKVFVD